MIDRDHILRPVNPSFIGFSLVAAFFMNLFPWGGWGWVPDFVALTLIFWSIYQPRKVGIGIAFLMGLVMDVHSASLLGENALATRCYRISQSRFIAACFGFDLQYRRCMFYLYSS